MSLTDSQIVDVAIQVNMPESVDLIDGNGNVVDVAVRANSPASVEIISITQPTVSIVATNTGPRGPQGESGQWIALTQDEYDAISIPDPDVLYVIIQ